MAKKKEYEYVVKFEPYYLENDEGEMCFEVHTVQKLIRCKDCKFCCHYTDGHLECRLLVGIKPIPTTYVHMNGDDFCSYGEEKE